MCNFGKLQVLILLSYLRVFTGSRARDEERFHSRGQHLCKFSGTIESKTINSRRINICSQDWFETSTWPPWRHKNASLFFSHRPQRQPKVKHFCPWLFVPWLLPGRIQVSLWIIVINKSHNPLVLWVLCEWSIQHSITNRAPRRALSKVSYWEARPRRFLYVFTAIKCILAFWAFLLAEMTDFPTLSYTSTSEMSTLSYAEAWKMLLLSGGGSQ